MIIKTLESVGLGCEQLLGLIPVGFMSGSMCITFLSSGNVLELNKCILFVLLWCQLKLKVHSSQLFRIHAEAINTFGFFFFFEFTCSAQMKTGWVKNAISFLGLWNENVSRTNWVRMCSIITDELFSQDEICFAPVSYKGQRCWSRSLINLACSTPLP